MADPSRGVSRLILDGRDSRGSKHLWHGAPSLRAGAEPGEELGEVQVEAGDDVGQVDAGGAAVGRFVAAGAEGASGAGAGVEKKRDLHAVLHVPAAVVRGSGR